MDMELAVLALRVIGAICSVWLLAAGFFGFVRLAQLPDSEPVPVLSMSMRVIWMALALLGFYLCAHSAQTLSLC